MRNILTQFEARGVHLSWAPYDQLLVHQVSYLYLLLHVGRGSTKRPPTPYTSVWRRWYVQTRSGMALFFTLQLLATESGRLLLITSACHEEAVGGGGVPLPCPPSFGLGTTPLNTHRLGGRSRPIGSTVVEYQAPSCSSGLTLTLREDWSGKRALETPCHTRIATSPQGTTDYVSGPAEPDVRWDTISRGNYFSRSKD